LYKLKWLILCFICTKTNKVRINKADANPISPPNLLGIDRKTAYKCRKYHSGWIWIGDVDKSEGIKLTGSADQSGNANEKDNADIKILILIISLNKKIWVNLIFTLVLNPPETELPLKCRRIKWTLASPNTMKGTKKWRA
jgi:hypothetical protein